MTPNLNPARPAGPAYETATHAATLLRSPFLLTMAEESKKTPAERLREKADAILGFPLSEVQTQDGQTTIKPADWKVTDAGTLYKQAAELEALRQAQGSAQDAALGQAESIPQAQPEQKPKKLTAKEQAWADAYLETFNKTEASRRAGYKGNDATLASIGYQNFRKLHIISYIRLRQAETVGMSKDEVLHLMGDQARFDPLQYTRIATDQRGQYAYIDLEALKADGLGHLVREISYDKDGRQVVKFYDAQRAQENLGKANGALSQAGESEEKPFIIKVVRGVSMEDL